MKFPPQLLQTLLMTIESEIQFEDFFYSVLNSNQPKSPEEIEFELNLILGISPLPLSMQGDSVQQTIGETQMIRKTSISTLSQDTNLCESDQESKVSNETGHNIKTSNHHNFQKHTVTALKDMVNEEKIQVFSSNPQTQNLATKLWREFLKIKGPSIMTKKFLSALFRNDIKSVGMLKPYGFKSMFENFSESEILQAKIELRRLVILCLDNQSIENHVEKRQIKRKEEFRLYLINFRQDLESANVKKRISKQSSDWIADNAKIFDCLN